MIGNKYPVGVPPAQHNIQIRLDDCAGADEHKLPVGRARGQGTESTQHNPPTDVWTRLIADHRAGINRLAEPNPTARPGGSRPTADSAETPTPPVLVYIPVEHRAPQAYLDAMDEVVVGRFEWAA